MNQTNTYNSDAIWLPFTPNRYFKDHAKVLASAQGAYYTLGNGKKVFDCLSGLWCCPLGHAQPKLVEALTQQAKTLDYATAFQFSSPITLSLAQRIAKMAPEGMNRVFFTNSGSEAVDTAMKMAYGYQRINGQGARTRFIGRERGYHGVGFGGMSVGGMVANRKMFGPLMLAGVDHLPHTHNLSQMAFSKGMPTWGAHLADELDKLIALHDASTIAAVILEPMQGSTGVIVPPVGYLKKIRDTCTKHGILLIFDEVITGFGRLGTNFGADAVGVIPDMITFAKGVNNGTVPMGGVIVSDAIYHAFMGVDAPDYAVEFFHGYTYSGHPLAAGVAHAALDMLIDEGYIQRAKELEKVLEEVVHSLKGESGIMDIRNMGMAAAIDLAPIDGKPGRRGMNILERGLENGLLVRLTGDTVALGPPFISTVDELHQMGDKLRLIIKQEMAQ